MDLISKKKLKSNLKGMEQSTGQCIEVLRYIEENVELTDDQKTGIASVISHQQSMIRFLSDMSGRL